jgi:hypothetical protein
MFDMTTAPAIPQNGWIVLPADQIFQMIDTIITKRLSQKHEEDLQNKELSKKETAKLLKVSEATIDNWSDEGILTKHHRGRICYFIYSEVIQSKTALKKYQRRSS